MSRFVSQSYYEILNVDPEAGPQEIRDAFCEAQRNFDPEAPALHALYDPDEAEAINMKLVEAFELLANPEQRSRYDRYLAHRKAGMLAESPKEFFHEAHKTSAPSSPQLRLHQGASLPSAPSLGNLRPTPEGPEAAPPVAKEEKRESVPRISTTKPEPAKAAHLASKLVRNPTPVAHIVVEALGGEALESLVDEHGPCGALLHALRTRHGIDLEAVSGVTKINIHYLRMIENDAYEELPARVYLRGFLTQLCQLYKLPPRMFVDGYLQRVDSKT